MDTFPNQESQEPQGVVINQDYKKKKRLLEIISFLILLIIVLGVLNYFNIIPLSNTFTNQLGFLPHRLQHSPTTNSQPIPAPTSTSSTNPFQYDTEKAKATLSVYIRDTIKQEFVPQTLDIKQGLTIDNRLEEKTKFLFGSYFINNQTTFSINLRFQENTNIPNDLIIFIQPESIKQKTLTAAFASSLVSSYFNDPFTPITNCDSKTTTSYCETFKIEDNGKRGYGAIFTKDQSISPPKPALIIFTCLIPKESKDYDSRKSCISL